jgi:putative peptide zinc metalloprotease protein
MNKSTSTDWAIRDPSQSTPLWRTDLRISFQEFRDERLCIVEDPVRSRFHRIGLREYGFLTRLDGKTPLRVILADVSRHLTENALTEPEAISTLNWALQQGLVVASDRAISDQAFEGAKKKKNRQLFSAVNLLFIRIPLFNPDAMLQQLEQRLRPWLGRPLFTFWCFVVGVALAQWLWHAERFAQSARGVLASDNWLWLAVAWVLLKVIHETGHGIACRYFGGRVPEAGIQLVLFTPMGYVNATSCWAFPSKWSRILVSAAGMYIELLVAALAMLVWAQTDPGRINTLAYNVVLIASVVTLAFNANPFLKLDAYYILSDYVEVPNLTSQSQSVLMKVLRRHVLKLKQVPEIDWKDRHQTGLLAYGMISPFFRFFMMVGLLIGASVLLGGGGIALAYLGLAFWLVPLLYRAGRYLIRGNEEEKPRWQDYGLTLGGTIAAILLVALLPWRPTLRVPGITEFAEPQTVRAECPGFIERIHVRNGESVRKGDLLVTLRNEDEVVLLKRLEAKKAQAEVRARAFQSTQDVGAFQAETQRIESLEQQRQEQQAFVETLHVVATRDGHVVGAGLDRLEGAYAKRGVEILTVAPEHTEVRLLIRDDDFDYLGDVSGAAVQVKVLGRSGSVSGTVIRSNAQASREIPHPAFTALNDGPLLVQAKSTTDQKKNEDSAYELLDPHFQIMVSLNADSFPPFASGESVRARVKATRSKAVWKIFYQRISRWWENLVQKAEQTTA